MNPPKGRKSNPANAALNARKNTYTNAAAGVVSSLRAKNPALLNKALAEVAEARRLYFLERKANKAAKKSNQGEENSEGEKGEIRVPRNHDFLEKRTPAEVYNEMRACQQEMIEATHKKDKAQAWRYYHEIQKLSEEMKALQKKK